MLILGTITYLGAHILLLHTRVIPRAADVGEPKAAVGILHVDRFG